MSKQKNNLDERQEQKLLQIEKTGCWFAFWALLVSIFIQQGIFGISDIKAIAGEWIIFMCLAIYLLVACIRNGIWDRHLKANTKTNFWISLVSSLIAAFFFSVISYINFESSGGAIATFVVMAVLIFVTCFIALSICTSVYRKRLHALEGEEENEEEPS